ncbi:Uncharacterised protein [Neisseria meningitidis]|nr:Uncharacterised protein [Neisseria meningitidis]
MGDHIDVSDFFYVADIRRLCFSLYNGLIVERSFNVFTVSVFRRFLPHIRRIVFVIFVIAVFFSAIQFGKGYAADGFACVDDTYLYPASCIACFNCRFEVDQILVCVIWVCKVSGMQIRGGGH